MTLKEKKSELLKPSPGSFIRDTNWNIQGWNDDFLHSHQKKLEVGIVGECRLNKTGYELIIFQAGLQGTRGLVHHSLKISGKKEFLSVK